ncbi:MAG: ADP-ribosylglycohydrolase family protein [Spirochaetota bacterium]
MHSNLQDIILGSITGDALGAPLDGMGEKHIRSVFKSVNGYIDPMPALKGKPDRWKKPGLYTANTQLLLFLSVALSGEKICRSDMLENLFTSIADSGESPAGQLRHPTGTIIQAFRKIENAEGQTTSHFTSGDILPLLPALLVLKKTDEESFITSVTSFVSFFSQNPWVLASSLIISSLYFSIHSSAGAGDLRTVVTDTIESANRIENLSETFSHLIFDSGWNPDTVIDCIRQVRHLLDRIQQSTHTDQAAQFIVQGINTNQKTPVTRPTVNHPISVLCWPCAYALHIDNIHEYMFRIAETGGSTSVFVPVAGAIYGMYCGNSMIPSHLIENLVNRKRILTLVESINSMKVRRAELDKFMQNESSLTRKEEEERGSRFKRTPEKKPRKRTKKENVDELSRHVVESWTKYDKAKWKKQKKKIDTE